MSPIVHTILLIFALCCFILAAWQFGSPMWNRITVVGLSFWVLSMLPWLLIVVTLVAMPACGPAYHAPPNLSPAATAAWHGTRTILALDTVRDVAVAAEMQEPKLLSTADTRKVVVWHEAAVKTIHEAPNGWKSVVDTGLTELLRALPLDAQRMLGPYVQLAKTVIQEVQ